MIAAIGSGLVEIIDNKEALLPTEEYCAYFDYPVEKHYTTTEDGYILGLYRIQAKNSKI